MILVKLGGSVITDKRRYRAFDSETASRLCREIGESGEDVIVVHGAGSFGHVLAKRHSLNDGFTSEDQIPAYAQVCEDVRELNGMVVSELNKAGIPAVSVPPGSCFVMDDREPIMGDAEVLRGLRRIGIMPVLFGDVVLDRKLGFAILSGDRIMEKLAELFDAEKTIFVSDIDGLYDDDPKTNPDARMYTDVDADTLESIESPIGVDDVTGGVRGKMESMLRMSTDSRECVLINGKVEGRLLSALRGEDVACTRARGGLR